MSKFSDNSFIQWYWINTNWTTQLSTQKLIHNYKSTHNSSEKVEDKNQYINYFVQTKCYTQFAVIVWKIQMKIVVVFVLHIVVICTTHYALLKHCNGMVFGLDVFFPSIHFSIYFSSILCPIGRRRVTQLSMNPVHLTGVLENQVPIFERMYAQFVMRLNRNEVFEANNVRLVIYGNGPVQQPIPR